MLKKVELESDGDTNCNWRALGIVTLGLVQGLEGLEIRGREYYEESWRPEDTCCHLDSSEKPSTNAGVKISKKSKIKMRKQTEENKTYKHKGMLEAETIKQVKMKEKTWKQYLRRTRKLLKNRLYSKKVLERNKHLGCPSCKIHGTILEMYEGRPGHSLKRETLREKLNLFWLLHKTTP